jgi:hypothetical protein
MSPKIKIHLSHDTISPIVNSMVMDRETTIHATITKASVEEAVAQEVNDPIIQCQGITAVELIIATQTCPTIAAIIT